MPYLHRLLFGVAAILLFPALFHSSRVFAQNIITCSSNNGKRIYCKVDTSRGVRLTRQISGSPCNQGSTWGFDQSGIWVDRGGRAEFQIGGYGRGGGYPGGPGGPGGSVITCSSNDGRRNFCNADTRGGVRLTRQISGSPCDQNRTWGYDRNGIWVDRGCRAEFMVGNFNRGGRGPGPVQRTVINCSSNDGKRHWCSADTEHYGARLVRQISGSPCVQGQTWGMQPGSVWVDRGCRADFEVVVP